MTAPEPHAAGDEVELPPAECLLGYPRSQVDAVLGDRVDEFGRWMRGQTAAICDGRAYDHEAREYRDTGCGPHGMVVYVGDVARFIAGGPILD